MILTAVLGGVRGICNRGDVTSGDHGVLEIDHTNTRYTQVQAPDVGRSPTFCLAFFLYVENTKDYNVEEDLDETGISMRCDGGDSGDKI